MFLGNKRRNAKAPEFIVEAIHDEQYAEIIYDDQNFPNFVIGRCVQAIAPINMCLECKFVLSITMTVSGRTNSSSLLL